MKSRSEARKAEWQDPEIRARRCAALREAALRRYQDPVQRAKAAERARKQMSDPARKVENLAHMTKLWEGRNAAPHSADERSSTPEYRIWDAMNQRCSNPKTRWWCNYGGRGIRVHEDWQGKGGFLRFFEHVGPRPTPEHTIDRIDNDGNYEPGNVRWATRKEQSDNSRKVRMITHDGRTMNTSDWAREMGLAPMTLRARIKAGWTMDRALSTPGRATR